MKRVINILKIMFIALVFTIAFYILGAFAYWRFDYVSIMYARGVYVACLIACTMLSGPILDEWK